MKYDRNYFRMLDTDGLINEGRDSLDELAIVLADRLGELSDVEAQLDEAKREIEDLNLRLTSCVDQALWSLDEIEAMQEMLDAKC